MALISGLTFYNAAAEETLDVKFLILAIIVLFSEFFKIKTTSSIPMITTIQPMNLFYPHQELIHLTITVQKITHKQLMPC